MLTPPNGKEGHAVVGHLAKQRHRGYLLQPAAKLFAARDGLPGLLIDCWLHA
jgi:hypothetical protein